MADKHESPKMSLACVSARLLAAFAESAQLRIEAAESCRNAANAVKWVRGTRSHRRHSKSVSRRPKTDEPPRPDEARRGWERRAVGAVHEAGGVAVGHNRAIGRVWLTPTLDGMGPC
jgi:hypothetical protein